MTYFEMLVVLVIGMILIGISTVHFTSLSDDLTLTINQQKILSAIHKARLLASTRHMPMSFCFANEKDECVVEPVRYLLIFSSNKPEPLFREKLSLSGQLFLRVFSTSKRYFTFTNEATNGTLWYCKQGKNPRFAIAINKFGNAHLLQPNRFGEIQDSRGKALKC